MLGVASLSLLSLLRVQCSSLDSPVPTQAPRRKTQGTRQWEQKRAGSRYIFCSRAIISAQLHEITQRHGFSNNSGYAGGCGYSLARVKCCSPSLSGMMEAGRGTCNSEDLHKAPEGVYVKANQSEDDVAGRTYAIRTCSWSFITHPESTK